MEGSPRHSDSESKFSDSQPPSGRYSKESGPSVARNGLTSYKDDSGSAYSGYSDLPSKEEGKAQPASSA